jgi:hypothetical protein
MSYGLRLFVLLCLSVTCVWAAPYEPVPGKIMSRWAQDVGIDNTWPEYPRPQMQREVWLNLNGLWDFTVTDKDAGQPDQYDQRILVPFAVESALSGIKQRVSETDRLWYHRRVNVPTAWQGKRLLLHFGAVDWDATVYVNGHEVGSHRGGYDAFYFDITPALKSGGKQDIVVSVWDPTDKGFQARGKQVSNPHGIWYTPVSGIWQTVWIEPVAPTYLRRLSITPDIDTSTVTVAAQGIVARGQPGVRVEVLDRDAVIQSREQQVMIMTRSIPPQIAPRIQLTIPEPKLWTPDAPHLYTLRVTLLQDGQPVDQVTSYVGMRKIAMVKDKDGIQRLMLNNRPLFQYGPLDQGFWPDGLYTAPTDEALRYDIEITKQLGFNMIRKHVKVEPARWYYWCDKLGILVWQDMPSGNFGDGREDKQVSDEATAQYQREWKRIMQGLMNHPSIVMWVPFNEGWGQHETARIVKLTQDWDPTRLVNEASGWHDRGSGHIKDIHAYPGPRVPAIEESRVSVLGEFGGLGLPVSGHTWQDEANWGYRSFKTPEALTEAYLALIRKLHPMTGRQGLSAAVYTQTTDVEVEVNGLMTYDRAVIKMDPVLVAEANKSLYTPPAPRRVQGNTLIPPATPLVTCDPYFSIWSPSDKLTDEDTVHWTGKAHRLTSMVRIDGKAYRLMGASPARVPALKQTSLTVLPTRTLYTFSGAGIDLSLTFMNAALPEDIELLSRPVTYLTYVCQATDGKEHDVRLYIDAMGELAVNTPNQPVVASSEQVGGLQVLKVGSTEQAILGKKGDDLRIDWGYLYLAAAQDAVTAVTLADRSVVHAGFLDTGLSNAHITDSQTAPGGELCAALVLKAQTVGDQPLSQWVMLAYDDLHSIQYMRKNLRPYWRRSGWEAADLLKAAARDYPAIRKRCATFDTELMRDLTVAGGERYAKLAALAYRHCFAASKFVADAQGQPLSFSKENHSNGCIGTSDVFYPMAPQFLLFGPSVAKSFIVPFMNYAESTHWRFPFAPHDLGTYPKANGQVYGGGEQSEDNQMPVEECGNLLILLGAVAQLEGHAEFAGRYWPTLTQWAQYLRAKGFDPENQLCTDDFAGHLAHNVNLSAKAICGLAAYAKLCRLRGDKKTATEYQDLAQGFARQWMQAARDGDHYRLAFDKPDTWSQKYNLVWDCILGLDLWPDEVRRTEMDYYRNVQNPYGLPLDNRSQYTKLDWVLWTATLTQDRDDFQALVDPVFKFLNETPDRVPMTDWYWTHTARRRGFTARPVVGGVFLQMLYQSDIWKKYAKRDVTQSAGFAALPKAPLIQTVVSASDGWSPLTWRYTVKKPAQNWYNTEFNDRNWQEGQAGFGTRGTPGARIRTTWNTSDIWLRKEFELDDINADDLYLWMHHDEDVQVYINGVLAARASGYTSRYEEHPINTAGKQALRKGKNTLAVHCRQTSGGQYIDVGLAKVIEQE